MSSYYLVVNHTKRYQKEDIQFFYYLHVNGAEPPVKGPVFEGQPTLVPSDKWRVLTHTGSGTSAWNSVSPSSLLGDGNVPMLVASRQNKEVQQCMTNTDNMSSVRVVS